jgi:hypothetical protein
MNKKEGFCIFPKEIRYVQVGKYVLYIDYINSAGEFCEFHTKGRGFDLKELYEFIKKQEKS